MPCTHYAVHLIIDCQCLLNGMPYFARSLAWSHSAPGRRTKQVRMFQLFAFPFSLNSPLLWRERESSPTSAAWLRVHCTDITTRLVEESCWLGRFIIYVLCCLADRLAVQGLHSWLYESPCTELAGERVYCWLEAFSCFLLKSSRTHCVPFACTAYMQRVLSCSFIGLNRRLYNAVSRFRIASVCTHWRVQFALAALLQPLALFLSLESVGVTESDADLVRWSGAATVTGPNFQKTFMW